MEVLKMLLEIGVNTPEEIDLFKRNEQRENETFNECVKRYYKELLN